MEFESQDDFLERVPYLTDEDLTRELGGWNSIKRARVVLAALIATSDKRDNFVNASLAEIQNPAEDPIRVEHYSDMVSFMGIPLEQLIRMNNAVANSADLPEPAGV